MQLCQKVPNYSLYHIWVLIGRWPRHNLQWTKPSDSGKPVLYQMDLCKDSPSQSFCLFFLRMSCESRRTQILQTSSALENINRGRGGGGMKYLRFPSSKASNFVGITSIPLCPPLNLHNLQTYFKACLHNTPTMVMDRLTQFCIIVLGCFCPWFILDSLYRWNILCIGEGYETP